MTTIDLSLVRKALLDFYEEERIENNMQHKTVGKRKGRATRGAFKSIKNPPIAPDFSTMDEKFMTPAQRRKHGSNHLDINDPDFDPTRTEKNYSE